MTTTWPDSLPPPLRIVGIEPGKNTEFSEYASGRRTVRNWGHRPADRVTAQFRIKQTQEAEFKNFWHRVGMDVTWFSADWLNFLPALAYPSYKARLIGYPQRKGVTNSILDFSVTLLVMPAEFVVDETPWLSKGSGGPRIPSPDDVFFAIGHNTSPYISVYPFYVGPGVFGAKFSNPSTLPAGLSNGVAFSPNADYIALTNSAGFGPRMDVYAWLDGGGFGARSSNPVTQPTGVGIRVAFSPNGDYISIAATVSPYIFTYPWSAGAFGTKYSNPSTLPGGDCQDVVFSPASDAIVVAHLNSPYIAAYPWSAGGYGTKFADPASSPALHGHGVTFSPNGSVLAVASDGNPWLCAYTWSNGFGAKFTAPSPALGNGTGQEVEFSKDGNYLAAGKSTTGTYIFVFPWIGGFGTKVSDPAQAPNPISGGIHFSPSGAFSPSGQYLAMASSITPFFAMYRWTGAFGGNVSSPMTLPTGAGLDADFCLQAGG